MNAMTPVQMIQEVINQRTALYEQGYFGQFDVLVPLHLAGVLGGIYFNNVTTEKRISQIQGVRDVRARMVSCIVLDGHIDRHNLSRPTSERRTPGEP